MIKSLRIGVADDEPDVREFYQLVLPDLGHQVVVCARNGAEFVGLCKASMPDLVIVDVLMPKLNGLEAIHELSVDGLLPAIVVSGLHDDLTLERAESENILAFLVKPIRRADLEVAISTVMNRFGEFCTIREELDKLRQSEIDRRAVLSATRVLMDQRQITAADALGRLKQMASQQHRPIGDIAATVLGTLTG